MNGPSRTCEPLAEQFHRMDANGFGAEMMLFAVTLIEPYQGNDGVWLLPIYFCDSPVSGEPIIVEYVLGRSDDRWGLERGPDGSVYPLDPTIQGLEPLPFIEMTVARFIDERLNLEMLRPIEIVTGTRGEPPEGCSDVDYCRTRIEGIYDAVSKHQHLLALLAGERTDRIEGNVIEQPIMWEVSPYAP